MTNKTAQAEHAGRRLKQALDSIHRITTRRCRVGLILGSGLGGVADDIDDAIRVPYATIDEFPESTAPGHKGELILGNLYSCPVALLQGRFHLYEGWQPADIALAVRTLKSLGADTLIVTNSAGALNSEFSPGDILLINDHMNFTGQNPLIGDNEDSHGLRFPDMSQAYCGELLELAQQQLAQNNIEFETGVYAGVTGPSLETSAERRFYRNAGADVVGMSTVIEVIAAVHAGCRVLGFSALTNMATGNADQEPDTIEKVLENAAVAAEKIQKSLKLLLPILGEDMGTRN